MIKRLVWMGVIAVGGGGIFYSMHPAAKSCESLVKTANVASAAANAFQPGGDLNALLATFDDTEGKLRSAAGGYKSPFDGDAQIAADDLGSLSATIRNQDMANGAAAVDRYNADAERINRDCSAASGGVDGSK